MSVNKILFEVEFDLSPIRHAYVTCPECGKKFEANSIVVENSGRLTSHIRYQHELLSREYLCPMCDALFSPILPGNAYAGRYTYDTEIKEVGYPKCAEGALHKTEVWK